jgi:thiosulfate dehydrogenase [quinone] large subunit
MEPGNERCTGIEQIERVGRTMAAQIVNKQGEVIIPDPPIAHVLFSTTRVAWLWAILRVYLGWSWLSSGWGKLSNPAWMDGGTALKGFWTNATAIPETGKPPIAFDWYRDFILFMLNNEWYTWFAKLVVFGEVLIGIALILGAFVGIAAFFGATLNWNFIMAGTASTNALLFVIAIVLMLAWKVAGWYGADRYLLKYVGTPWTWGQHDQAPNKKATA